MSKFLKFIVFVVVTCAIVCTLGLMVPPYFGITTLVMDDPVTQTNLPLGSVTYAIPVPVEEITEGSKIIVTEDEKMYRYQVTSFDQSTKIGTVIDPTVTEPTELTVKAQNYVKSVVITIGYVGYLSMLTKSMEGIIIYCSLVFALIFIYIIAEMWRKDPDEDEDEEDEIYVKSAKELKREEKEREKRMKEDDRELLRQEKARKKQKKNIIKTGGFVDEILEEDEEPEVPVQKMSENSKAQAAASEAHEVLKKEIAATTEAAAKTKAQPKKKAKAEAEVPAEPTKEINAAEVKSEVKKRAIPAYTVDQLADKAKKSGDKPDVLQDDVTKVTLFDYSDIIGNEE